MLSGRIRLGTLLGVMFVSLACGGGDGDGGTGPGGLTFPPLSSAVNAQYCVRGNATIGANKTGTIAASDCDYDVVFTGQGYFEIWRVRVAEAASVTFTVSAPSFDSYIDVGSITIANGDVTGLTPLGSDDDTNGDDPVLTLDLVPDTDYIAVISGFDYPDVGSYTLSID